MADKWMSVRRNSIYKTPQTREIKPLGYCKQFSVSRLETINKQERRCHIKKVALPWEGVFIFILKAIRRLKVIFLKDHSGYSAENEGDREMGWRRSKIRVKK